MGGAIGAFIFIWWYGTRSGLRTTKVDELRAEVAQRTQEVELLKKQLQERAALQQPKPLSSTQIHQYTLTGRADRRIVLITGDIRNVRDVDVWVNSENTDMQMSRFHERSISGVIRYEGARHDLAGRVVEDCMANELKDRMGGNLSVEPGTAIVTGPGELAKRNGVKAVVHVAAGRKGSVGGPGRRRTPKRVTRGPVATRLPCCWGSAR